MQSANSFTESYKLPKIIKLELSITLVGFLYSGYLILNGDISLASIASFFAFLFILLFAIFMAPLSIEIIADRESQTLTVKKRYLFKTSEKIYTRDSIKEIFFQITEKNMTDSHIAFAELTNGKSVILDYPVLIDKLVIIFVFPKSFQKAITEKENKIRNLATFLGIPVGNTRPLFKHSYTLLKGYDYREPSERNNTKLQN